MDKIVYEDSDAEALLPVLIANNQALRSRVAELVAALEQLANNDLSDENCASVELAGRRVRNIARAALANNGR